MKPQVISFQCVLKNSAGLWISTTFSKDVFSEAPAGETVDLPELAKKLKNVHKGEHRSILLKANEAYGFYDPNLVLCLHRKKLPVGSRLKMGECVRLIVGENAMRDYRITEIRDDILTLDANHPLAGQDLVFDIDVTDARYATDAELSESLSAERPKYLH